MAEDVRLVLLLLTPILLAIGLWVLNSVSGRITTIEEALRQGSRQCEERHRELWEVIRGNEKELSRLRGRMNGWRRQHDES